MNTTIPELTLQIINITQDEILNTFYKMIDDKAIENNKHTELKNLIQLLDNETLIKLHLEQDTKYLKYKFNIWRYFETHETDSRERALNIRMSIINSFSSNIDELNNNQLYILYFQEIENKKIESINIYDAKVGDIIRTLKTATIYSRIYKMTKNYLFLETFENKDIKKIRYDQLNYETIYITNFKKLEFKTNKIKIFKRNEGDKKPDTIIKVKDNITYIIDTFSYYCD
jgi:hypothetical protein